jgi:hypothetical protein
VYVMMQEMRSVCACVFIIISESAKKQDSESSSEGMKEVSTYWVYIY